MRGEGRRKEEGEVRGEGRWKEEGEVRGEGRKKEEGEVRGEGKRGGGRRLRAFIILCMARTCIEVDGIQLALC